MKSEINITTIKKGDFKKIKKLLGNSSYGFFKNKNGIVLIDTKGAIRRHINES